MSSQAPREVFPSSEDPALCAAAYASILLRGRAACTVLSALLLVAKAAMQFTTPRPMLMFWVLAGTVSAATSWQQASSTAWLPSQEARILAAVQACVVLTSLVLLCQ